MKKFQFSLKKLSNYKEQVLRKEKNELATLRNILQLHKDERQSLITKLEKASEDFNKERDFTPQKMAIHRNYTLALNDSIIQKIAQIDDMEKKIEKQLDVVLGVTKELNSFEMLESKQLEEYNKTAQKQNELFIEEFVSNSMHAQRH